MGNRNIIGKADFMRYCLRSFLTRFSPSLRQRSAFFWKTVPDSKLLQQNKINISLIAACYFMSFLPPRTLPNCGKKCPDLLSAYETIINISSRTVLGRQLHTELHLIRFAVDTTHAKQMRMDSGIRGRM